jgi:hypothetical protein
MKSKGIFPFTWSWNLVVSSVLKDPYPPSKSSSAPCDDEPAKCHFDKIPPWTLICEEAVDTEYSPRYYHNPFSSVAPG